MPEKYEREIEEILRRASFETPRPPRRAGRGMDFASTLRRLTGELSPARLLVIGLILALVGYVVAAYLPAAGAPLSLLAIAFLVSGFFLAFRKRRHQPRPGWRGRQLDTGPSYREIWSGLKRRWDNWRRRGGWGDRPHF